MYGTLSIYPTPQSLESKVEEYFETCFVERYDSKLNLVKTYEIKPPTMSGLARFLGFSSRAQLLSYRNENALYEQILADARLRIEDYLEQKLVYSKAPTGIMFSLKNNAGWEDKSKTVLSDKDEGPITFQWAANAADVIDTEAVNPKIEAPRVQIEGGTPPGEGQKESTGDNA